MIRTAPEDLVGAASCPRVRDRMSARDAKPIARRTAAAARTTPMASFALVMVMAVTMSASVSRKVLIWLA